MSHFIEKRNYCYRKVKSYFYDISTQLIYCSSTISVHPIILLSILLLTTFILVTSSLSIKSCWFICGECLFEVLFYVLGRRLNIIIGVQGEFDVFKFVQQRRFSPPPLLLFSFFSMISSKLLFFFLYQNCLVVYCCWVVMGEALFACFLFVHQEHQLFVHQEHQLWHKQLHKCLCRLQNRQRERARTSHCSSDFPICPM